MLALSAGTKVFLAAGVTDLRRSVDGLALLVAAQLEFDPLSADFFDDGHYVMKGASPATARELIRPTFRNWFRPRYPFVYATFRCVREEA